MDQIEEVRRKTDIVGLISQYVPLKKTGRNFSARCPFHEEKTPSFMVSEERQIFKCFGCGEGGDVFKFLMKKENMEFGEALRFLADKAGVELKNYQPTQSQKIKERLAEINHLASEYFHYLLLEHNLGKKPLQYLLKRAITKASIKLFKLGYSPDSWDDLQRFLVNKKKYQPEDLELAGLIIKGNKGYYDRFRGRIMFPLFDLRGRIVGFSGRVLEKEAKEAKYINSPETLLYRKSAVLYGLEITKDAIKKANRAIVVEGEFDLISSYQAGVKNVVAIKGSALTQEQIELIKRFAENASLALDSDMAGEAASRRGIELAEKAGLNLRVIKLKFGKDPDECSQKSARLWKESVREAVTIYDFLIESAVKRYGLKTIEGKRKVSGELAKLLRQIDNQVVRAHYIKKVAELLKVNEEAVKQEVEKSALVKEEPVIANHPEPKSRRERLEEFLLALIVQAKEGIEELVEEINLEMLSEGAIKKIIINLKKWLRKGNRWEINQWISAVPEELVSRIDEAYLTDLRGLTDDLEKFKREFEDALTSLKKLAIKERMEFLSEQIKQAERQKDKERLGELEKEFREKAKQLI